MVNAVQLLVVATFLHFCQAKSLRSEQSPTHSTDSLIWRPKNGTMSDWLKCHGMPKDMWQRTRSKYQQLQETLLKKFNLDGIDSNGGKNMTDPGDSIFGGCIWLSEEQIDMLMTEAKITEDATETRHRMKRTLTNLVKTPDSIWSMPVHYKFDGTHDQKQKSTIRNAVQHWMDNTCIRFKELPTDVEFDDNHLLFTSGYGCHSLVGRMSFAPQPVNLHEDCFEAFGTSVHEIGHALGLWHEQMRQDRDAAIKIIPENIYEGFLSQYALADSDSLGLPYNYGSVMHYSSKGGASTNGKDTMIALEPLYQMNMGQRTGLSFHDTKIINLAYCQDSCSTPLSQPCLRGGYQNPNKCSTCICPDGFSGKHCEKLAPAKHATCGGELNLSPGPGNFETIKSPGYDTKGYTAHQECNWLIKVPKNHVVLLTFDGDFGIYCESSTCYHWVEIKYKKDLGLEGGRFCCNRLPSETIVSESNEMMVTFRSNYTITDRQRGFQAVVEPIFVPTDHLPNHPDSTITASTESARPSTVKIASPTTTPKTHTTLSVSSQANPTSDSRSTSVSTATSDAFTFTPSSIFPLIIFLLGLPVVYPLLQ